MNIDTGDRVQNTINVNPDIRFMGYRIIANIIIAKLEDANTLNGSNPFPINAKTNTMYSAININRAGTPFNKELVVSIKVRMVVSFPAFVRFVRL